MNMKRMLMGAALALGMAIAAPAAHAAGQRGYVCDSGFVPSAGSLGSSGYVWLDIYSNGTCGGNYVGTFFVPTAGNSYGVTGHPPAGLFAVAQNLVQASMWNMQVFISYTGSVANGVAYDVEFDSRF
jgi:hypothetical protein